MLLLCSDNCDPLSVLAQRTWADTLKVSAAVKADRRLIQLSLHVTHKRKRRRISPPLAQF